MAACALLWGPASLAGLVIGVLYWNIEAAFHSLLFHGGSFWHELVHGDANEIWMRSFTLLLFVVLGAVVQWHLARADRWNRRLRTLARAIDKAGEAILITDVNGDIEYTNPAFSKLTGYAPDEVRGRSPSVLKSGAHGQSHYRALWTMITAGQTWSGNIVDRRKDGTYYPALLTIAPVADDRGDITHFVGIQRDMSEQVARAEHLRQVDRLHTLEAVAGGIADSLSRSLGLLGLQLDAALLNAQEQVGNVRADLGKLQPLLRETLTIVDDLNSFARRGPSPAARTSIELHAWLDRIFPELRLIVPENVPLRLYPPLEPAWVKVDGTALQRVLLNLVQNARDAIGHRPGGEISIGCECTADGQAWLPEPAHLAGVPSVLIRVRDNGPGIDPALRDRIFEPFFSTKGASGSGLGLATARETVERHGGTLRVVNPAAGGAEFQLLLPRAAGSGPAA